MSEAMRGSSDNWFHDYYQQSIPGLANFSDTLPHNSSAINTTDASTRRIISSSSSGTTFDGQLNPKSSISKPLRRRFRASKSTPVTLLNADVANFRALVQKFTGCSSDGNRRGPINLNFATASGQHECDVLATSMEASNGYKGNFQPPQVEMQQQEEKHEEEMNQDYESIFSYEKNIMTSDAYTLSCGSANPNMQAFDEFHHDYPFSY